MHGYIRVLKKSMHDTNFVAISSVIVTRYTDNESTINGSLLYKATTVYRLGFDCEIPLTANCEFFHNSQSKESQLKEYAMNITHNHAPLAACQFKHSINQALIHSCTCSRS